MPFKITILINIRVIFNKMELLQDQKMVFSAFHKRSGKLKIKKIMQIQHFLMLIYFFTLCSLGKTKVSFSFVTVRDYIEMCFTRQKIKFLNFSHPSHCDFQCFCLRKKGEAEAECRKYCFIPSF